MKEIIQVLLVYLLFLSGKERVSSLPTESTVSPEDDPTTFHTAELLISPKQNAKILEPSSTFFIVPTSTLENTLGDDNSSLKYTESSSQSPYSSVPDELSTTTASSYAPPELTTFETVTTSERRTNIDVTTSQPIHELDEGAATMTSSLKYEELQTDTTLPMVYPELIKTELVTQTVEVFTTVSSTTTTTTTTTTTSTTTTTTTTTTSTTTTTERKWTTTTTSISPTPKETIPTPVKTDDPLLYSYQNDPHWDLSMDFSDYQEEIESKKDKSKLNNIQLMDEGVKDSMTIVLTPINFVRDAMVHIKYKRISKDPTEEMKSPENAAGNSDMTTDVSFPLLNEENRRNLENLPEGWYFVCAEVTKFDKMLEQECFHARIFEKTSPRLETGIIVLIVLAMLIIALLAMYIVYNKLQKSRRKKKDKEMQDRIDKMAQKERELNERNKPAFHHIYVDPDEPYEERCIM